MGTVSVAITCLGAYTDKTIKIFAIKQVAYKATADKSSAKRSFTASDFKKAKTTSLPKVATKFGKAKWKAIKKDRKNVLALKNGKIKVKKCAEEGTYAIKLKACVA